jgi:predicted nucleic acid-binding protein
MDGLIAAIALTHGMALATRDARDFAGLGFEVIYPFDPR